MPQSRVALIGRPNVGKSTLFNRLLGGRRAIVRDEPGVTRDRNEGEAEYRGRPFQLIDTGGFLPREDERLTAKVRAQAETAVEEADLLVFVLDAKEGLTPIDEEIHNGLRKSGKPIFYAVNKTEGKALLRLGEFYRLGPQALYPISAEHGTGVDDLMEAVYPHLLPAVAPVAEEELPPRIVVLGRPNTGKSTLVNALLGKERLVTSEIPGTTRDAIDTLVHRKGKIFRFVDTAGIRRRARRERGVEHFSVGRALEALGRGEVALLLLDGVEGVTDQDAKIGAEIAKEGKGCLLLVNKWDVYGSKTGALASYRSEISRQLPFLDYAPIYFISALKAEGLEPIFGGIERVCSAAGRRIGTGELNRLIHAATEAHPPPLHRGRAAKIYYATQTAVRPPTFILFVNQPTAMKTTYLRYLENRIRREIDFEGTPIRIRMRKRV